MNDLKVATAQFEHRGGDKSYNLSVIRKFTSKAAADKADLIAFHECSITGYLFAKNFSKEQMQELAEPIPAGASTQELIKIAAEYDIAVCAGLFEKDDQGNLFKAYVCVDKNGLLAKFRKLHPFINKHLTPGSEYCVFEFRNWKFGILICYDNNVIENVRATTLLGAEVILMPHVTMCTPSPRPGAGFVDVQLWQNRLKDPTSLRIEFDGLKGREWLMKWLPARAYDNGVYCVFANSIGMDHDQLKNGCSMILDPFGDILSECRKLDDDYTVALLSKEKINQSGGSRYLMARRPELYKEIIGKDHLSEQSVTWIK